MMKQVEKHLPKAIDVLTRDKAKLTKEFKGYIASFGASLIHAGLLPTLAFYSDNGSANKDRKCVLDWLKILLETQNTAYLGGAPNLLAFALGASPDSKRKLQKDLVNAAIALKLALRTFNLE